MKRNTKVIVAIACLALAVLSCQALAGGGNQTVEPNNVPLNTDVPPAPTAAPANPEDSNLIFRDDFSASRSRWGTDTNSNDSIQYLDEALNFQIFTGNYIVWSTPNDKDYENIHMEVTVINNGTDTNTAFGFKCDMQHPITDSHYYFAVTAGGQYAIAKAALALDDVFLTNNDEWGDSDLIAKDADSYRVGADCGTGKLTLYVDGQEIASVDDTTYTSGGIALFAWSAKDATTTDVSFDDFEMTRLP